MPPGLVVDALVPAVKQAPLKKNQLLLKVPLLKALKLLKVKKVLPVLQLLPALKLLLLALIKLLVENPLPLVANLPQAVNPLLLLAAKRNKNKLLAIRLCDNY